MELWLFIWYFTLLVQIVVTFSFDTSVYIHYHEFKADKKQTERIHKFCICLYDPAEPGDCVGAFGHW